MAQKPISPFSVSGALPDAYKNDLIYKSMM